MLLFAVADDVALQRDAAATKNLNTTVDSGTLKTGGWKLEFFHIRPKKNFMLQGFGSRRTAILHTPLQQDFVKRSR